MPRAGPCGEPMANTTPFPAKKKKKHHPLSISACTNGTVACANDILKVYLS
jgi:hypothetical protein